LETFHNFELITANVSDFSPLVRICNPYLSQKAEKPKHFIMSRKYKFHNPEGVYPVK
jgi:hypothetical protein